MAFTLTSNQSGAGEHLDDSTPDIARTADAGEAGETIQKLTVTNITAAAVEVTVYIVPSGGSISGDDYIIAQRDVPAEGDVLGGVEDIREVAGHNMDPGDSLRLLAASASALKFNYSGLQVDAA